MNIQTEIKPCLADYPDALTVDEVIAILRVSRKTVYELIKDGRIKAVKVGRSHRIAKENLIEFLNPPRHIRTPVVFFLITIGKRSGLANNSVVCCVLRRQRKTKSKEKSIMPQAKNHLTASTQAKNGSLYAVIQYKDENGKRKNKWKSLGLKEGASKAKINAAMREAVNAFEKELTEILTRSQNPDADMPVFEYMVKWLGSVQPSLQINTYRSYHNMIYGRIKRYFSPKSITIASLRPNQIDEFYQSIFDEGMVANTVIHYHAVMRRAFQQAYKKEILSANPFDRVERPKKNKFFGQNLSEEELLTLLSLARTEAIYPAIILAGCMGLRRSEALGMRWSRIDMEKREVLLDTKVVEVEIDGEKILKPIEDMKNSSSRRSLPIPAPVYEMLVEQKAQQYLYRHMFKGSYNRAYDDYVCTDKLGKLLTPRYVTLRFSQVLEKNGMRHIRFHDLRHTFATMALENGMDIKTLSAMIGHVSAETTVNVNNPHI